MGKTIGIDLGTTNSCMAIIEGGAPKVIRNAEGELTTPSVVALTDAGPRVGLLGRVHAAEDPASVLASTKRLIGRPEHQLRDRGQIVPYEVVAGPNGDACVQVDGRRYTPPEISAMILAKLKADAESYLGETVDGAVITVPAGFDDHQRQAVKEAGKLAGLDVKRIVNESSAVALAYALEGDSDRTIAVFRGGGGTCDVSVLQIGDGVSDVRSIAGDNELGGDDFDEAIVDWLVDGLGVDATRDATLRLALLEPARRARIALTTETETEIVLPLLLPGPRGVERVVRRLSRSELEALVAPLVQRVGALVQQAVDDAKEFVGVDTIDQAVVAGGLSAMPALRAKLRELLDIELVPMPGSAHAPALGAAIQAGVLVGDVKDVLLLDATALTLGIETKGGVMTKLIERNTTIPTRKAEVFSTADDNQPSVEIHVLQGEREMAQHNKSLGKFQLTGIPPAPRGKPMIEVAFDLDLDGIVSVSAKDLDTGKAQTVETLKAIEDPTAPLASTTSWQPVTVEPGECDDEVVDAELPPRRDASRPDDDDAGEPARPGIELFYSYSHHDERLRRQLETHLSLLRRQGLIDEWHDRLIDPGDAWEEEIDAQIRRAKLILLLVSPNFMDSDYCYEREMRVALERHERGEAHVVPVILRPVDWQSGAFGHLQALPRDGKPVIQWGRRDSAWLDVSSGLRRLATDLMRQEKRGRPRA